MRLSCLSLATGHLLWDVPLDGKHAEGYKGLNVSSRYVFITNWSGLQIRHLADGSHRMTLAE
jgi:hypothetical protein